MIDMKPRAGSGGVEPTTVDYWTDQGEKIGVSSFLEYLHTLKDQPLSHRQREILEPEQKPIAELFTVFDCTDYYEFLQGKEGTDPKKVGLLSYSLGKRSLAFMDYVFLVIAMVTGDIDNHGGYFSSGDPVAADKTQQAKKPEAYVSKQLIYGLACLGFKPFLESLSTGVSEGDSPEATAKQQLQTLSKLCAARNIQVLLAAERYNRDVLGIVDERDRDGY